MTSSKKCFLLIHLLLILILFYSIIFISKSHGLYFIEKADNSGPYDFRFIDSTQKIYTENYTEVILPLKNNTNNFRNFSYLDLHGVKFSFLNGIINAFIAINNKASIPFPFENGDTYGMALNIGDFSNTTLPQMNEADYIYELQFKNKTWHALFATQFANGEQKFNYNNKSIPQADEWKFLDQDQHYLNMTFDTKLIGSPDRFQVKYFSLKETKLNQSKYTLFDDIPWIEIPSSLQQVSLEPNVTVIYNNDTLNGTIKVESTSPVAQDVFVTADKVCPELNSAAVIVRQMRNMQFIRTDFPHHDYCWSLPVGSRHIEPPYNVASFPFVLKINKATWPSQDVSLNVKYATGDSFAVALPHEKRFHIRVGDWFLDRFYSLMNFLNNYNGAIGFVIGTATVPIISYVKNQIVNWRKKNTQSGDPKRGTNDKTPERDNL
jgi:hypothetical protein